MSRTIATWMRECDDVNFRGFLDRPERTRLRNARVEAVEVPEADALLLTGGPDISGRFLRQPVWEPAVIQEPEPERDEWEFAALQTALARGLPILAVCKGMQLLNVALGGTLHLDIPGHSGPDLKYQDVQPLRVAGRRTIGFERVNSSHHQALSGVGTGLRIEAWSAADEIIEQVRLQRYPFCVGVQYHPERGRQYQPLFDLFVEQIPG